MTEIHGGYRGPSDAELRGEAASLLRHGTAEGAIALVSVSLDEQERQARQHRRAAEERAHEIAFERIDAMRDKARERFRAAVATSSAQVARGALAIGAAAANDDGTKAALRGTGEVLDGGGGVADTVFERRAHLADLEAERLGVVSEQYDQHAARGDAEDASRSLRDRALRHFDAVADSRTQARLAAIRG